MRFRAERSIAGDVEMAQAHLVARALTPHHDFAAAARVVAAADRRGESAAADERVSYHQAFCQ